MNDNVSQSVRKVIVWIMEDAGAGLGMVFEKTVVVTEHEEQALVAEIARVVESGQDGQHA
jgi:hypothetical protein